MGKVSSIEEPTAKVSSIFVYPIKSCRGISVSQAPISVTGNFSGSVSGLIFKTLLLTHPTSLTFLPFKFFKFYFWLSVL